MGGATLEDLTRTRGFSMPSWDASDANVAEAWQLLSARCAASAAGTVRVIAGPVGAGTASGTSLSFRRSRRIPRAPEHSDRSTGGASPMSFSR
jgi:hypothetical protein